jgi:hypothetical protein
MTMTTPNCRFFGCVFLIFLFYCTNGLPQPLSHHLMTTTTTMTTGCHVMAHDDDNRQIVNDKFFSFLYSYFTALTKSNILLRLLLDPNQHLTMRHHAMTMTTKGCHVMADDDDNELFFGWVFFMLILILFTSGLILPDPYHHHMTMMMMMDDNHSDCRRPQDDDHDVVGPDIASRVVTSGSSVCFLLRLHVFFTN